MKVGLKNYESWASIVKPQHLTVISFDALP